MLAFNDVSDLLKFGIVIKFELLKGDIKEVEKVFIENRGNIYKTQDWR